MARSKNSLDIYDIVLIIIIILLLYYIYTHRENFNGRTLVGDNSGPITTGNYVISWKGSSSEDGGKTCCNYYWLVRDVNGNRVQDGTVNYGSTTPDGVYTASFTKAVWNQKYTVYVYADNIQNPNISSTAASTSFTASPTPIDVPNVSSVGLTPSINAGDDYSKSTLSIVFDQGQMPPTSSISAYSTIVAKRGSSTVFSGSAGGSGQGSTVTCNGNTCTSTSHSGSSAIAQAGDIITLKGIVTVTSPDPMKAPYTYTINTSTTVPGPTINVPQNLSVKFYATP